MKQKSPLSGEAMLGSLREQFDKVTDHRNPLLVEIPLRDFLLSGFAVFSLKFPSLLKFEEERLKRGADSNLKTIYKITRVPCDTHLRSVLDQVNTEDLRRPFRALFARAHRAKALESFRTSFGGKFLLALDGSQYFSSDEVHCASCLEKWSKSLEKTTYYHQMLCGSFVHPDKSAVVPICPEPIKRQEPTAKQNDAEIVAFKRMIDRFRNDYPKLKVIILADALHAHAPNVRLLDGYGLDFIFNVKPGKHAKLFQAMETWDTYGATTAKVIEDVIGEKIKKRRTREFRYANRTLLNHSELERAINFLDCKETIQWIDKDGEIQEERKRFTWATSIEITDDNVLDLMRAGRTRWKIENETFNALKNHGYEFEHNFGHGFKNLTTNFAMLMMLAFLFDQLQTIGSKLFQKAVANEFGKRSRVWSILKGLYEVGVTIQSYTDFIDIIASPKQWRVSLAHDTS